MRSGGATCDPTNCASYSRRASQPWPPISTPPGHPSSRPSAVGLYDYVEFVGEYGPYDLHDLDNLCRAAEVHNMSMMIKVDQEPRGFFAQRAIGSGFHSVLFADCRSAADVLECVRIVRPETPEDNGTYGVATRRFTYMGYGGSKDYVQALRDIVVTIMIEKPGTVDTLEEVLAVPGVDMVQWGGSDYSMGIGRAGERHSPELKVIERRVFETALKMGIPPRAEIIAPMRRNISWTWGYAISALAPISTFYITGVGNTAMPYGRRCRGPSEDDLGVLCDVTPGTPRLGCRPGVSELTGRVEPSSCMGEDTLGGLPSRPILDVPGVHGVLGNIPATIGQHRLCACCMGGCLALLRGLRPRHPAWLTDQSRPRRQRRKVAPGRY